MRTSLRERFESSYIAVPEAGCWLWEKGVGSTGYGHIFYQGKMLKAHRVSWELHRGLILKDMCVLHKCDVPSCVNPDHLFLGTHKDNKRDSMKKGRHYIPTIEEGAIGRAQRWNKKDAEVKA